MARIDITVVFEQGSTLVRLVDLAVDNWHWEFHFVLIISFGNDLLTRELTNIKDVEWEAIKPQLIEAVLRFRCDCRAPLREVVFGGNAEHWDVQYPMVFQERVQIGSIT